jgi:hypothetical protein
MCRRITRKRDLDREALERIYVQTTLLICTHCEAEENVRANRARLGPQLSVEDHSGIRDHLAAENGDPIHESDPSATAAAFGRDELMYGIQSVLGRDADERPAVSKCVEPAEKRETKSKKTRNCQLLNTQTPQMVWCIRVSCESFALKIRERTT